ncbi:GNAT family N-acetyltransferase [Streptomyces geranii]|uniref:GNAT family N-acetyltransferase n=1 Tax=Streptomyces geranii TaxID=2058923 RepID=UPI001E325815|nr:GNAT family N-acetyltransferase [Streptomyces geranii]
MTVSFVAAVLVAGGIFYGLVVLLDIRGIASTAKVDAKTLFDLVKLSFGVVAGSGALVALVVAYRRQRVDEAGAHREATRLHTERFSQAVDKLGSDSPAVRLGGVHALAGLADDAPDDNLRQTCIDVLCAYLQLPFTPDPGNDPADQEEHHRYLALRKVRHTILRLIGDHYRRPKGTHRSWQGCDLDLTGVTIDTNMDFRGAVFSSGVVNFGGAMFSGGTVNFDSATFSGGAVYFTDAVFSGGEVSYAVFSAGAVHFDSDTCRVGSINKISIDPDSQRQGLGRRLVLRAFADSPGYTWQTTGQSPEAKQFFPALERELRVAFPQNGGVCEHLASPPGRRPRPVLIRNV